MAKLFLSVRVPEKSYSLVTLENIDLGKSVYYLKEEIARKIDFPKEQMELMYCGNVMDDHENICELDVRPCTLIHVFRKTMHPQPYVSGKAYSEEDCQRIADLFGSVTGTQINVNTRIKILQKIIGEFKEFRKNIGAQALIRDSILFHTLNKVEVIKKVAQNYPIICDAAEFIVKTTKKEIAKNERICGGDETFSDQTSSSEEENPSNVSQSEQARIRRISRDQLAAALTMAGTASLNSLSNIAQRNASLAEEQQRHQQPQNPSSSGVSQNPVRITSSIFSNALNQALQTATGSQRIERDQTQSMDTTEEQTRNDITPTSVQSLRNQPGPFSNELQILREMGLTDDNINLQALTLSNGDVQAAVNLVLGGTSSLYN